MPSAADRGAAAAGARPRGGAGGDEPGGEGPGVCVSVACTSLWSGPREAAEPDAFIAALADEARRVRAAGAGALEFPADVCVMDERYAVAEVWRRAADVLADAELGATVHLPFVWVDLGALDREVWEGGVRSVERALAATVPLHPAMAAVHPANYGAQAMLQGSPSEAQPRVALLMAQQLLAALQRLKDAEGAEALALENLEGIPMPLFVQVAETADVPVCVDVGHCVSNGDDPVEALKTFAKRLKGVHLHDALPPAEGAQVGRAHLPLGEGQLDLAAVTAALATVVRERAAAEPIPVVLEVEPDPMPSLKRFLASHAQG